MMKMEKMKGMLVPRGAKVSWLFDLISHRCSYNFNSTSACW